MSDFAYASRGHMCSMCMRGGVIVMGGPVRPGAGLKGAANVLPNVQMSRLVMSFHALCSSHERAPVRRKGQGCLPPLHVAKPMDKNTIHPH